MKSLYPAVTRKIILFSKNAGPVYPREFHSGPSLLLWFTHEADNSLELIAYSF